MTANSAISGPHRDPASGDSPRQLIVFLHGWGADGNDLIGLATGWSARLPNAYFVAPHAPQSCEANPFGRQWFSLADTDPEVMSAGAARAAPVINEFIDQELARFDLSDDSLALVGFSQGTMMALYVALRRRRTCAAVVGYSGALVGSETLAPAMRSRPPVLLVHGDADPIVPASLLPAAADALERLAVPVRTHVVPGLGHGIDPTGLELGIEFLASTFDR